MLRRARRRDAGIGQMTQRPSRCVQTKYTNELSDVKCRQPEPLVDCLFLASSAWAVGNHAGSPHGGAFLWTLCDPGCAQPVENKHRPVPRFFIDLKSLLINNCCWKFAAYLPCERPVRRSRRERREAPGKVCLPKRICRGGSAWDVKVGVASTAPAACHESGVNIRWSSSDGSRVGGQEVEANCTDLPMTESTSDLLKGRVPFARAAGE